MRESGHVYIANKILQELDGELKSIIEKHKNTYLLGSVLPDALYYSKRTIGLAEEIHGKDGQDTSKYVLKLLDLARDAGDKELLAFVCGYVTHIIVDVTTHPIVYGITGNYYDKNKDRRVHARMRHSALEQIFDKKLIGANAQKLLLRLKIEGSDSLFAKVQDVLGLKNTSLKMVYSKRLRIEKRFGSYFFYYLLMFLIRIGVYKNPEHQALFYMYKSPYKDIADIDVENMQVTDLQDGHIYTAKLSELVLRAVKEGVKAVQEVFLLASGKSDPKKFKKNTLVGRSLAAGVYGLPVTEIITSFDDKTLHN